MIGKHIIPGLLATSLSLFVSSSQADELVNYRHDSDVDAEWEILMSRREGDPDFKRLYSLRKKLCAEVDSGRLSLDDAIDRFEAERKRVIQERMDRLQDRWGGPGGVG